MRSGVAWRRGNSVRGLTPGCENGSVPKLEPTLGEIATLLGEVHGSRVSDVEPLSGGFWSSAYSYRVGDRELVLRLGASLEDFEKDRAAMRFSAQDLPVPEIVEIGEALGVAYAISVRHHGRFLEDVTTDEADTVGPTIVRLLQALRHQLDSHERSSSWHEWLLQGLCDEPGKRVSGWRAVLAQASELDKLFCECEQRITTLLAACPERRDLVHGDLLHRNVLISEDARRLSAVFSWKCSTRGDFLYDTAWCTFWSDWHPGIAAAQVWDRVGTALRAEGAVQELLDAPQRHHCYELQIGASHLGWNAWTGNAQGLREVAERTGQVLERGPLAESSGA